MRPNGVGLLRTKGGLYKVTAVGGLQETHCAPIPLRIVSGQKCGEGKGGIYYSPSKLINQSLEFLVPVYLELPVYLEALSLKPESTGFMSFRAALSELRDSEGGQDALWREWQGVCWATEWLGACTCSFLGSEIVKR